MSVAAPSNFNAEEADNLEDVRIDTPNALQILISKTDREAIRCESGPAYGNVLEDPRTQAWLRITSDPI